MSSTLYEREGPSCVDERFDVFSYPLVESAIERTFESEFLPETTLSDKTKQILIKIDPLPNFVDLSSISTEMTVKITLGNGDPLPSIVPVTTAIMLATSTTNSISKKKLSSLVTSSLDKTPISSISSQYHLRNNRTLSKKRHDSATSESSLNSNTSNEYHLRKRKRDKDQMGGWTDEWTDRRAEKKKKEKKKRK